MQSEVEGPADAGPFLTGATPGSIRPLFHGDTMARDERMLVEADEPETAALLRVEAIEFDFRLAL
jgi:hypothetical protein